MDQIIIKLENVKKSYRKKELFKNVNLEIKKGKTVGIIGENGCGKSVLFKIISGLVKPDTGRVIVNEEELGKKRDFPENIGILINSPGYIEVYNGYKNLEFLGKISGKASKENIIEAMELVGLDSKDSTKVKDYSLGMKQKLGIAQAIMENQEIIILDEPFNALDFKTRNDMISVLKKLKKRGKTILITSHIFQDVEELCDDIYIISDKQLKIMDEDIQRKYQENK